MTKPFTLQLINDRSDEDLIYLLLTGDQVQLPINSPLQVGVPQTLADLRTQDSTLSLTINTIKVGRLYIGYADSSQQFPLAPLPGSTQYFGWIEFSNINPDGSDTVWINLSNVDITALPLTLKGKTANGQDWSLGYGQPIQDIIADLRQNALLSPDNEAAIACSVNGQTLYKILGPNHSPQSYGSYDSYIQTLRKSSAKLILTSDPPTNGGKGVVFTGSFLPAQQNPSAQDWAINLTSEDGHTLQILAEDFTTQILYQCDGGSLYYDGKKYPQNRTPDNDPLSPDAERTITNSTFRNILIGINEGYFSTEGDNYSSNFPYLEPFKNGLGSAYANILHQSSNSYGFPYADSNLKVLITASPDYPITLTICTDNEAKDYDADPPSNGNKPNSGQYQFGIGAGSADLGKITTGNCVYLPDSNGAYGGYLPTLSNWTPIHFSQPDHYIWFKTTGTGAVAATTTINGNAIDCFNPNPIWNALGNGQYVLQWGANVTWNPAATQSPNQPTS